MDHFSPRDIKRFECIQNEIPCTCGNPLWCVYYAFVTGTYTIKCLNCQTSLKLPVVHEIYTRLLYPEINPCIEPRITLNEDTNV